MEIDCEKTTGERFFQHFLTREDKYRAGDKIKANPKHISGEFLGKDHV